MNRLNVNRCIAPPNLESESRVHSVLLHVSQSLTASDPSRSFRHRVVQVSAAPPRPCPRREREASVKRRVGASQVRNPSVILSSTLARNEEVEHYIRIKTHKPIVLRFWVDSGVNASYGWAHVSLVCYISPVIPPPYKP